jgi:dihydrofolate reductase
MTAGRPEAAGGPELVIVVAVGANGVIGRDGEMPWRLPTDLRHFRAATMGLPVVMGRRTFESIGRPLDGRTNIVVSRNADFAAEGVTVVRDVEAAIAAARAAAEADGAPSIAVIGGGTIYAALLPRADRLLVTHVDAAPEGDTRFGPIDPSIWTRVAEHRPERGAKDTADIVFAEYRRREPRPMR